MPVNKGRAAKTARDAGNTKNSRAPLGEVWDKKSGPDENDGRANLQAGDKGREPGGRWSTPAFDRPAKIVGKINVRDP